MDETEIRSIERPHSSLLALYFIQSLAALIAFPIVFLPLFFKYHTLRYRFDDEGVSAKWGILFRREIYLTYRRIQDIHVSRNLFERWLGIGKVEVQTASGSASAELSIEGMDRYEEIRDYLYGRMRGTGQVSGSGEGPREEGSQVIDLLRAIKDDIEGVRQALENRGQGG